MFFIINKADFVNSKSFRFLFSFILILLVACSSFSFAATELVFKNAAGATYSGVLGPKAVGMAHGYYDSESKSVVILDHSAKAYSTISIAQVSELIKISRQALKSMTQMRAYLPPEYRATLDTARSKGLAVGNVQLDQVGPSRVASYACQKIRILQDEQVKGVGCFASASVLNLPADDLQAFQQALNVVDRLLQESGAGQAANFTDQLQGRVPLSWVSQNGENWTLVSVKSTEENGAIPIGYDEVPFDLSLLQ